MIKEVKECRLCGGKDLTTVLDFGETALANAYTSEEQGVCLKSPLNVFRCDDCFSFQLKHTVDPEILYKNYLYESSTSQAFKLHFEEYAKTLVNQILCPGDFVVDIGSNDNILLKPLKELGMEVLGVEPAKNITSKLTDGIPVVNDFFSTKMLDKIYRRPKVITCNNCFAHIDDLREIINGVKEILSPEGVFVFENAYWLSTVQGKYFPEKILVLMSYNQDIIQVFLP